jgi:hypothetical protein
MNGHKDAGKLTKARSAWQRMLELTPVHNAAAHVERTEEGVSVTVRNERPWFLRPPLSWVLRLPESKRVVLDELGEDVWEKCDGKRRAETIIELFAREHELSFHEARVMVGQYLGVLAKRGVLAVVAERTTEEGRDDG